jgi:CRP-like cAMP-binding protein
MEYASFLRSHIESVIGLSDDEFDEVLQAFDPMAIAKKSYLIQKDQRVTAEYLVVEGCLKTFAFDDDGKEYIVQFATENWWVSDYPAYLKQGAGEMSVQALEPCVLLKLTFQSRQHLCKAVPKMSVFFGAKALSGYAAAQRRALTLLRNNAREKYLCLLEQYPELFQRIPRKTIAHYLGVSRETLSRLEKRKQA